MSNRTETTPTNIALADAELTDAIMAISRAATYLTREQGKETALAALEATQLARRMIATTNSQKPNIEALIQELEKLLCRDSNGPCSELQAQS